MSSRAKVCAAALCVSVTGIGGPAAAEPVNYGELEALFEEPITLSATGAPLRATEAPVNMVIISQDEIRRSGAIDLPGVLARLASVDVMRSTGGQADVSIRGYNTTLSPRLLVLLNGRQVYLDIYGMTDWDLIPVQLSEIRQIEVVTGPNTALFGFNALAGVVNIITFDALVDDIDEITLRVGASEHRGGALIWSERLNDRLGARLSLGGFGAEALDNDNAASQAMFGVDATDPEARTVALNLSYEWNARTRINAEATWGRSQHLTRYGAGLLSMPFETNSLKLDVSSETDLGLVSFMIYSNGLEVAIDNRISAASLELVAKPASAHTLRVAGEFRRNELDQGTGDLSYDVAALSGMWSWRASSALALTGAVRYDHLTLSREGPLPAFYPYANSDFDREFGEWSYNFGGVYRLSGVDSLRISAARGVGLPSLLDYGSELNFSAPGVTLIVAGDPTLEPVIADNLELGWDHDLPAIGGRSRAVAFWQKNEALRAFAVQQQILSMAPLVFAYLPREIGASEMHGVELSVEGSTQSWRWGVAYSWRDIDDDMTFPTSLSQMDFEAASPENVLTANLAWAGALFEWGVDLRYQSATRQFGQGADLSSVYEVDAHVLLNARAEWRLKEGVSVELAGRNLLDSETQSTGLAPMQRSAYVTLRASF
jgi:outer membrane receptor for ferrienterochelin and colicins